MTPAEIREKLLALNARLNNPWAELRNPEQKCSHTWIETFYFQSNGTQHFRLQCSKCGAPGVGIRKSDASPEAVPFDDALIQKSVVHRTDSADELRERLRNEWFELYDLYLSSPEWRSKRERVLIRDDNVCKACEKRRATQVHHLTYARVCIEPLFDLVSVCDICHQALHEEPSEEFEDYIEDESVTTVTDSAHHA